VPQAADTSQNPDIYNHTVGLRYGTMRHLTVVIVMIIVWINGLVWLCKQIDPSTRYQSEVEYRYARYCAGCHGNNGQGNGRIGRFKKLDPADLTDNSLWELHDDEQLLDSINTGKDDMPAFYYYLSDEEQREILDYIKETFLP
jgi:mono/diheme cytochrome c family protein